MLIKRNMSFVVANPSDAADCTETFAHASDTGREAKLHDDEYKVLGVTWNVSSNQFVSP